MPKGKTGRPRGRPKGAKKSSEVQMRRDALAIAFSVLFDIGGHGVTPTMAARLANRLADPSLPIDLEGEPIDLVSLVWTTGGGTPESIDRYTQTGLTLKGLSARSYSPMDGSAVKQDACAIIDLFRAPNSFTAAAIGIVLAENNGWPKAVSQRLVALTKILHRGDPSWETSDLGQFARPFATIWPDGAGD